MANKMHPIEAEIAKAFGLKRGASESDKAWKKKLHEACVDDGEEAEAAWDNLSDEAQAWANGATDASNEDEPLPDFESAEDKPAKGAKKGKDEEDDEPKSKGGRAPSGPKKAAKDEDDDEDEKPARGAAKKGKKDEEDEKPARGAKKGKADDDDKPAKKPAAKKSGGERNKLDTIQTVVLTHPDADMDKIIELVNKKVDCSEHTIRAIAGAYKRSINHLYDNTDGPLPKKSPFA